MEGLHHQIAKILESEDFSLWQKLNSFVKKTEVTTNLRPMTAYGLKVKALR